MATASDILGEQAGPYLTDDVTVSGVNGVLFLVDARGWLSGSLSISPAAGEALPSAGAIILEQHNDREYTGAWAPVPVFDPGSTAPTLATSALPATAAAVRSFFPSMRFLRARVSTALTARPASAFVRVLLRNQTTNAPGAIGTSWQQVQGTAVEDATATGSPILSGGKVRTSNLTTLVAGDVAAHTATTSAQLLVKDGHLPELDWGYAAAAGGIINTTDVAAKAAAGASLRNYVYSIQLKNANAVAGEFVIKDGAVVMWRGHLSASMVDGHEITFRPPLKGTANTAVNIACITTGQQVYANVQGGVGL